MIQSFSCASVGDAPKSPGIYAWYGRLDIGDSDYLRHVDGERDLGELRFRALLARNSQRYDLPDMHVRLTSSFEAEWHATCAEVTSDSFIKIVSGAIQDQGAGLSEDKESKRRLDDLSRTLAKQKSRLLLKRVLESSVPDFAAPLYVGVTADLNRRLGEHVSLLRRLVRSVRRDPTQRERLRNTPRSGFAARAVAAGFDEEYLEVRVLNFTELETEGHSGTELREVAGAAEWLLNRWHRPYLGRR